MNFRVKANEVVHENPYQDEPSGTIGCVARLVLLLLTITLVSAAALLLYFRWLGAGEGMSTVIGGAAPNLDAAERLYLQTYLASHASQLAMPAGSGEQAVPFEVAPGQTANDIANGLTNEGLLQDKALFLNYLRYHGLDSKLEAGTYLLDPKWTIPEVALSLTESQEQEIELRFLEGWRAEEMTKYLSTITPAEIDSDDFLDIVERRRSFDLSPYSFLNSLPSDVSLEGFLFPDTYRVPLDADAEYLVDLMLRNFDERVTQEMQDNYTANGLTLYEAVTLASIVERETPEVSERPMVAAVFYNRLAQDMPLQADPTVQYAVGYDSANDKWWKSALTQADLDFDSPYNTYLYEGLPPGPIANPGLASLQAVAQPSETDNLFFVADCNAQGAHLFSKTYDEHLVNVEQCR